MYTTKAKRHSIIWCTKTKRHSIIWCTRWASIRAEFSPAATLQAERWRCRPSFGVEWWVPCNKMGIDYIHANGEAEAYAAELCRISYVDAVMSEDMDTLVYDCPMLIRACLDPVHLGFLFLLISICFTFLPKLFL